MTRRRGGVLLEGLAGITLLAMATLLAVELARRAQLEIALHHGAFLSARHRVVGIGEARSRRLIGDWLRQALGEERGARVLRSLHVDGVPRESHFHARLHYRFPQLWEFSWGDGWKHHFEVTKSCRFPFSRR